MNGDINNTPPQSEEEKQFPGYPSYPKGEDIYSHDKRDESIDPDDKSVISKQAGTPNGPQNANEEELDIPGAELDDEQEKIGNEDEENNYYSLGGDNHQDLEEDQATGLD